MHPNGSDGYFSFTFFLVAGIKVENSKLRTCQNMAWKGFCCLVIFANLHNLPCICIKMATMGTFFNFLVIVGIKGEKRTLSRLAHDKTCFGRRFCCLVIYATLHNLPCICIIMAPAGTFSLFF